jgi:hypothetical protein
MGEDLPAGRRLVVHGWVFAAPGGGSPETTAPARQWLRPVTKMGTPATGASGAKKSADFPAV